ncbi:MULTISPECIES: sugar porter family MFS transporter [unclassified Mucilaginibacter]|uniref:sugar porter family MFS transporter n=1 Tax=unclassified Mucilaginibacter TaxID=2617802 RepID=UPI00138B88BF|nr:MULTISPECIES: sugar porter family MFS transporter [unclassified Mucilaginibacter]MBB5396119.1 SP family arabinose:H+ symporter-like MFS transporter [Mucilaginibacter sp. AK015]QHS54331.1 sugar porter family MFS transporter [Mucilaginibacter sp. 14171R-50]
MSEIALNTEVKKSTTYLYLVCLVAALGGFLFGFDTAVISGTVSLVKNDFSLDAVNEGWFVSCALLGCIIGVSLSGKLSDKYGRKIVLILSAVLFLASALGCMLSGSFTILIISRLVGGLGIGVASMVSPLYISEFSPPRYRGMMVSLYQLALTIGIVLAYFSNAYLAGHTADTFSGQGMEKIFSAEVWRAMLGMGALPAAIFLVSLFLVPESPRWLLLKGETQKAKNILIKIDGAESARRELEDFNTSNNEGEGSLKELFTPVYRRALWIGLLLPFLSQVCGINAVIYYGPRILEQAGFTLNNALGGQVTIGIVNVVFTFVAIFTVDKWGRKPLLFVGIGGAVISLIIIGALFALGITQGPWILIFILAFIACFAFSFGPVCWVVIGEIFPNAIRGKAMALATLSLWIGNFLVGQLTPVLLEGIGSSWTFWVFALCCSPALYITWKLIPETKGKSLEMIEAFWKTTYRNKE